MDPACGAFVRRVPGSGCCDASWGPRDAGRAATAEVGSLDRDAASRIDGLALVPSAGVEGVPRALQLAPAATCGRGRAHLGRLGQAGLGR